jgi:hypothetical protein
MNRMRILILSGLMAIGGLGGASAWADRGGHFRGPGPGHYHRHYYYGGPWLDLGTGLLLGSALYWATRPPPSVYVTPEPVVVAPPPQATGGEWWYYCRPAGTYYPYVQQCPTGWERVAPYPVN